MDRSLLDQLLGLGEAGLTLGTGAVAGAVGMPYGLFKGITGGNYGTREGVQQAQREAQAFMERNTYQPRTEAGQGLLQSLGKAMEASKLPPVIPEAAMLASIPRAAAAAQTERLGMAAEKALEAPLQRAYDKGGLSREMLLAMGQNTVSPATVFHGSPHLFQRFDSSKIGTGEGAQVYGHGLYLAENPAVAGEYALNLANKNIANQGRLNAHANAQRLASLAGDPKYAADDVRFVLEQNPDHLQKDLLTETLKMLESGDYKKPLKNKGNLYQVDLPDEQIAKMLDYDKPLSEQSEFVRKAIQENELDYVPDRLTGGRLLEELHKGFAPDVAAKHLRDAGIPGIRYLDEGSRGAGKGTSNFVVFPGMEDMLRIEQINEQPISQGLIGQF